MGAFANRLGKGAANEVNYEGDPLLDRFLPPNRRLIEVAGNRVEVCYPNRPTGNLARGELGQQIFGSLFLSGEI